MAVDEVAWSIAMNGYFEYEPLFVQKEDGKLVVIEGNRRLAAVKILLDKKLRGELRATDLPEITKERAEELSTLPVIHSTREGVWQYLGYKHVNGPAEWGSFSKAEYIARVHRDYNVPLEEIAERIGDRHLTVQRLHGGWVILEQAEQNKVLSRDDRAKNHFAFSHL
ncbi:MAG TPA: ParB N-terminal domain-containing protein [Gemmataceae bacterium]|nr:ParB N-terminal domain-containing protein [Gemmataceae bacterium]